MQYVEAFNEQDRALEEHFTDPFTYEENEMAHEAFLEHAEGIWDISPDMEFDPTHVLDAEGEYRDHNSDGQEQTRERLVIPKMNDPAIFDGRVADPDWEQAKSLPLVQHVPDFGEEPTEETEFLIGYSENYLYVGCRCYDTGTPTMTTYRRNYSGTDGDWIGVTLDTFSDNENGLSFFTGPTAFRTDMAVFDDASGVDLDWNTFWQSEAHITDDGWTAAMRIPISSLRFSVEDGRVEMGVVAVRNIARKSELSIFPAVPPEWGGSSTLKPSQAQKVVFEDLKPQTMFRVTPYALGGMGQQSVLNADHTAYEMQTEPTYDAGLDIKYGLTDELTLDVTINTDFAQVEADDQVVNLDRFPLFFPEKRQFFQERSSNFAFNFSGSDRLFYSRRIGLHQGQPVRILGGARVVGRTGPWDIGVLNMQTALEADFGLEGQALSSENFGVARFRRQVFNPYSYVGTIFTNRIGMDGDYNLAYGLDGIFRIGSDDYLSVRWAQTFDDDHEATAASLDPSRIHFQWERRTYTGLSYDLRYDRAGEHYRPGVGFELRHNYFRLGDRISYGWRPEGALLEQHRASLNTEAIFRNTDGLLESLEVSPEWEFHRRGGGSLRISFTHQVEDLPAPFPLFEGLEVPEGRHAFQQGDVSLSTPTSIPLRSTVRASAGSFYDGWIASASLSPIWNLSRHVRLSGFYQLNRIGFPDRNQERTAHIGRLRMEITPNVQFSLQNFVQYNSATDSLLGNIRFRYNPREGNDFYIVYNEQLNTNRTVHTPHLPLSDNRTLLLKYTYTFDL